MRHLKSGRKLNRNAAHRRSLFRNMACALIEHGQIITTEAKAKELRPFVERLITLARPKEGRDAVTTRRLIVSRLGPTAKTVLTTDKANEAIQQEWLKSNVLRRLLERAAAYEAAKRPGGYTRVIKMSTYRIGDGGSKAVIAFVDPTETKAAKEESAAPTVS
jgi:large subunit ribosomal protein L17